MTVIIGAVHNNSIFIGADSLYSWGEDFVRTCKTSKFIPVPDNKFLLAGAGQDKFTQIFIRALRQTYKDKPKKLEIKNISDVYVLADVFQNEVIKSSGIGEPDHNQLPEHDMTLMLASPYAPKIYVIESDYNVMEFDDYICSGAGFVLGEAAMKALATKNVHGREAVEIALNTVCDLHPGCGRPLDIRELKLRSKNDIILG